MAVPLTDLLSKSGDYKSYILLFISNIILLVTIYSILSAERIGSASKYAYIFISMSLVSGLLLYNVVSAKSNDSQSILIAMLIAFVFIGSVYQFDSTSSSFHDQTFKYATYLVGSLCIFVGLAMLISGTYRSLRNMSGLSGFIINFIFYLPCLINDFTEFIKTEFKLTPPTVYILFAIEMLLISVFVAISYIPRIATNLGGTPIVSDSKFLDSKYVYKNVKQINKDNAEKIKTGEQSPSRYAISLWTFVNQRTHQSERSVNIFSYGSEGSWKPRIEFVGAMNQHTEKYKDVYRITCSTGFSYDVEVASQKWNNFVFNYNGDFVDLFINGVMVRSFQCIPSYNITTDQFIVGDDNGVYGAICNVNYYNEPLTLREITTAYNLLNGSNPPINNI